MSRPVQVLAAAALVALVTIAILAFVPKEGADRAGGQPAQAQPSPESASRPDPSAVALGVVDDDLRRESAATPEAATSPAADAATALLRVRAVSVTTRAPVPRARLTVFPTDPSIETNSVDVEGSRGSLAQSPVTDADGRAEFALPPGIPFVLWIRGQDAGAESGPRDVAALRAGEQREMLVELATGDDMHFVGRVVSRSDGRPVDAWVEWRVSELGDRFGGRGTDPEGYFELDLPSWRHPFLRVEAKGFGPALVTPGKGHESVESALVIELDAGATLDARVLDAAGGPIEEAIVRLTARSFELRRASRHALSNLAAIPDEVRESVTDREGRCVFADLPADVGFTAEILRAGVTVRREGEPMVFGPGQVLEREWRIGAGGSFVGVVVDQHDAPVADLEIWLARRPSDESPVFFQPHEALTTGAKTASDGEGRFEFRDVPPGTWWIGPGAGTISEPAAGDVATQATRFEMVGDEAQRIRLLVHRGLYIRGRVVDPAGQPRPKAQVLVWGASRFSAESGADGRFAIGPLVPGAHTLLALGQGNLAASDPVEAEAGREDVELRLRPGGSVRGRVVDARTGEGCQAEMRLALEVPGTGWNEHGVGWTCEPGGSFEMDGLEPGRYGISAGTDDGRFGVLRGIGVAGGAETSDLVVPVTPGGKLRLLYEGKRTGVRCMARLQGVPIGWGWELETGKPIEEFAPAGALDLRLWQGFHDELETRSVVVAVGELQEIVFRD